MKKRGPGRPRKKPLRLEDITRTVLEMCDLKIKLAIGELIEKIEAISGADLDSADRMDIIIRLRKQEFNERRTNAKKPGKGSGDL